MDKFLQIETQNFLNFYDKCTPEIRESLKPLFGTPIIEYLAFKIKTYEDASNYVYGKVFELNIPDKKAENFAKLQVITKALNDGWNETTDYYYPTFVIEDNQFKFKDIKRGKFETMYPFSSPFKFRDSQLAEYCAKQFIQMFKEFYI